MKIVLTFFYYLLIFLSCLAGAFSAKKQSFQVEIIFLSYVAMTTYAILEIFFKCVSCLKAKILYLRVFFLVVCVASSFFLLFTNDNMVTENELGCTVKALNQVKTKIEPRVAAYKVNIKFQLSNDQLLDLVGRLGFEEASLIDVNFLDMEKKDVLDNLSVKPENVLCFIEKDEDSHGTKYLIYDTEAMMAYYVHKKYK